MGLALILVLVVATGWFLLLGWRVLDFATNVMMLPIWWLCENYPLLGITVILSIFGAFYFFAVAPYIAG